MTFLIACLLLLSSAANAQLRNRINLERAAGAVVQGVQSFTITDAQIIARANEFMEWTDANNPLCRIDSENPHKRAVAERLAYIVSVIPQELIDRYNLDIQAYFVSDINAFAVANGSIRMFAGLMSVMSDDEVLAVVGHEIGHIANNDSRDRFVHALRMSALRDAVGSIEGTAARLTDSELGDLSVALARSQFSQTQEFAADAYAFDFMLSVGRNPNAVASALSVLLNLSQEAGIESDRFASWFSSHPDLERRVEALNAMDAREFTGVPAVTGREIQPPSETSALIGSWSWESTNWLYTFNADGTGTRGAPGDRETFRWSNPQLGHLSLHRDNPQAGEIRVELWTYTITGNTLTIVSRQEAGVTFSYTRVQ